MLAYGGGPLLVSVVHQAVVAGAPRPRQGVPVGDPVGGAGADHLPGADDRVEQLGPLLGGEDAEDGAPGLSEQVHLVLAEPLAQVLRDGDRVGDGAVQGECRGGVELVVGASGAALVEGDDGEVLLEGLSVVPHRPELGAAGSTGEEEQHRVLGALTADHHGQVVAVDVDPDELGDAPGERLAVGGKDRRGAGRAGDAHREHGEGDGGEHGHRAA